MLTAVSALLALLAGLLAIPVIVLFIEVFAAVASRRKQFEDGPDAVRPRVAVLIPAHNESSGVVPTIEDISAQLRSGDRLLVIADNCTDDTAAVAQIAGAEVIIREDQIRIGKGYALDFGIRHLEIDPPEAVIIIDADCRVAPLSIDALAKTSVLSDRPVQALDLMTAPETSSINYQVAEFAWRVKNWVRPLGLSTFNLPCQLMGTGMAFPWHLLRSARLASGRLVEDLQLGMDFALAGKAPVFCPAAVVTSHFPISASGAETQRQRWEHGHMGMIQVEVPRFIGKAIARRNKDLLALALDLAVPPLSLLGLLLTGLTGITGLAALLGLSYLPFWIAGTSFIGLVAATFLAWLKFGRDLLPATSLVRIGAYAFGKIGLYMRYVWGGGASRWIRTDRKKS